MMIRLLSWTVLSGMAIALCVSGAVAEDGRERELPDIVQKHFRSRSGQKLPPERIRRGIRDFMKRKPLPRDGSEPYRPPGHLPWPPPEPKVPHRDPLWQEFIGDIETMENVYLPRARGAMAERVGHRPNPGQPTKMFHFTDSEAWVDQWWWTYRWTSLADFHFPDGDIPNYIANCSAGSAGVAEAYVLSQQLGPYIDEPCHVIGEASLGMSFDAWRNGTMEILAKFIGRWFKVVWFTDYYPAGDCEGTISMFTNVIRCPGGDLDKGVSFVHEFDFVNSDLQAEEYFEEEEPEIHTEQWEQPPMSSLMNADSLESFGPYDWSILTSPEVADVNLGDRIIVIIGVKSHVFDNWDAAGTYGSACVHLRGLEVTID